MRWLTPGWTQYLSLVKQTKAFALILGVKNAILHQLMESKLQ